MELGAQHSGKVIDTAGELQNPFADRLGSPAYSSSQINGLNNHTFV
jgi:hypothetical protein